MEERDDETLKMFGCPWKGHAGQKQEEWNHGADEEPYSKSCPRYYWEQEPIQMVLADLADYRRGALGNVWDLPAPHLDLLRVADAEEAQWDAYNQARMMEKARADGKGDGAR